MTQACAALVRAYLTDRKSSEAIEAGEGLTATLSALPEARQVDRVRSSILVAHGYAHRGDFEQTNNALTTAVELTKGLKLIDGVLAYTEIATFYLPTGGTAFGDQLLTAAIQTLARHPTKAGDDYVGAVKKLAWVLNDLDERREDLITLLTPVFDQAQERSTQETEYSDSWRDYLSVSHILIETLKKQSKPDEAERRKKMQEGWPGPADPDSAKTEPATMTRSVDPMYPRLAKSLRIQGTVILAAEIGTDGRVVDIDVERPVPYGLTSETVRAVRQWRYAPMLVDGVPTPASTQINVVFLLP